MGQEHTRGCCYPLAGARLLVVGPDPGRLASLCQRLARQGASLLSRDTYEEALLDLDDCLPDVVVALEPPVEFVEAAAVDDTPLVVAGGSDAEIEAAVARAVASLRRRDEDQGQESFEKLVFRSRDPSLMRESGVLPD